MKVTITKSSKAKVKRNIKEIRIRAQKNIHAALIKSAALVRRSMDLEFPLIPVDLNNLRASYFTSTFFETSRPYIVLGFTAQYAARVHQMTGDVNWQRPGSGPLYFSTALDSNRKEIIKLIQGVLK